MPRKPNDSFGQCQCRRCGAVAEIRRLKNHPEGARYLHCPQCGTDRPAFRDATGQAAINAWIDQHTITEQQAEQVQEQPEQRAAQAPEQQREPQEPAPNKGGRWIDAFI